MDALKYRNVLLKLSGEALSGFNSKARIALEGFLPVAEGIEQCLQLGGRMVIVVGGGNFVRGRELKNSLISPNVADQMGMLATVMNALALNDFWQQRQVPIQTFSMVPVAHWIEPYEPTRAKAALQNGKLVLLAGGTGNTHLTTDTAAALRGIELEVDVLLKATTVDGVFTEDPRENPKARPYSRLSFQKALKENLRVMDQTAFALCQEYNLPIIIFSLRQPGNLPKAMKGENVGTIVEKGESIS